MAALFAAIDCSRPEEEAEEAEEADGGDGACVAAEPAAGAAETAGQAAGEEWGGAPAPWPAGPFRLSRRARRRLGLAPLASPALGGPEAVPRGERLGGTAAGKAEAADVVVEVAVVRARGAGGFAMLSPTEAAALLLGE